MTTEDALLAAVFADPADDAPRLIYADWLDEQGDCDRAEFIRVQIELAHRGRGDPEGHYLRAREHALLAKHGRNWAAPLANLALSWSFRRGFVDGVKVAAATFLKRGADLFAAAPIRHVSLVGAGLLGPVLPACAALALVASLDLSEARLWASHLALLLNSPHVVRLEALSLGNNRLRRYGAAVLATAPLPPSLTRLELQGNLLHNAGAVLLANCPRVRGLRVLGLRFNGIGNEGANALATSPCLDGLIRLDLRNNYIDGARQALRDRFGDRVRF
jgi:uncharacterized protein (TIGR02996 family)